MQTCFLRRVRITTMLSPSILLAIFQPTLPSQGATSAQHHRDKRERHFNPRSPHRERQIVHKSFGFSEDISIHAPLTGSDVSSTLSRTSLPISIHAPLTGSDIKDFYDIMESLEFQSTLPSQGATLWHLGIRSSLHHFNPRSPHRERPNLFFDHIHRKIFQSTLPSQGATDPAR